MKVIIKREYLTNQTKGLLLILDKVKILGRAVTLELPQNGNQHFTSCIPEGKYQVEKYISPTKGECFKLLNVPDRTDIFIHRGNFAAGTKKDTLGCILCGYHFEDLNNDGNLDVAESTATLKSLLEILPGKFELIIL